MRMMIAAWAVAMGYAFIYYALAGFKALPAHVANNKAAVTYPYDGAHINAFGFATLLGLKADDGSQGVDYAKMPFAFIASATTAAQTTGASAQPASSPSSSAPVGTPQPKSGGAESA